MSVLVPAADVSIETALLAVEVAVAVVYAFVAYRIARRDVPARARLASYQFSLWWAGLGATSLLSGLLIALALGGALPYSAAITIYVVSILLDCLFLWGLVGFLTYVYIGKYHLLELGAFYSAFYVSVLFWSLSQRPEAVVVSAGVPTLRYAGSVSLGFSVLVLIGLVVPEILGAVLYLSLLRRTRDPAMRYRISLVGGSLLLWFALDIFVPHATAQEVVGQTVLEVIPGLLSLLALLPPARVRRWLDARSVPRAGAAARAELFHP